MHERRESVEIKEQLRDSGSWYNDQVLQATGMIVAQTGVTADEALTRLVECAQRSGESVDHVAAGIVERTRSIS